MRTWVIEKVRLKGLAEPQRPSAQEELPATSSQLEALLRNGLQLLCRSPGR